MLYFTSARQHFSGHARANVMRDIAQAIANSWEGRTSRRLRKKIEILFAHLKRILKLDRLRLRGPNGARDEFLLAATARVGEDTKISRPALAIPSQAFRRPQRQRVNRERGRFASTRRGKHARVRDPQVAPAMAAAGGIDHRAFGIVPHPAGAEDMGRAEPVPARIALENPFRAARGEQLVRFGRHEAQAGDVRLVEERGNPRHRHAEPVAGRGIKIDAAVAIRQPLADRADVQRMTPQAPH